jgi:hypothetical protein
MSGSIFHRHRGSIDEPFWFFRLRCAEPQAAGVHRHVRVIDRVAFTLNGSKLLAARNPFDCEHGVSTPKIALVCLRRCEQIGDLALDHPFAGKALRWRRVRFRHARHHFSLRNLGHPSSSNARPAISNARRIIAVPMNDIVGLPDSKRAISSSLSLTL